MSQFHKNQAGYSMVEILIVIVVLAVVGAAGFATYYHYHKNKSDVNSNSTVNQKSDQYAGWKTSTSTRAKFSIKYPADWKYSEVLGTKDNVEHLTLTGSNVELSIDSYSGKDPANGGTPNTTCADCKDSLSTQSFTAGKLGTVNLETVTYTLDSGFGNALILRQADGVYYLTSPNVSNVYTSFRAISILPSEQDYQNQTPTQFSSSSDYKTAQKILESVTY